MAGSGRAVPQVVLHRLGHLGVIDWSRASLDSSSVRAAPLGAHTGPSPTDHAKAGSKYHRLLDRRGVPLAVPLAAANGHASKLLEPLVDAVQPSRQPLGQPRRPRKRPTKRHAAKRYDDAHLRLARRQRGITPRIARWVVEWNQAWVVTGRKLTVRS